jgi:type II secretory pathway predicted ATPase ExeA
MIRAHFGLSKDPFSIDSIALLEHQQETLDTLRVHCQQGGFCLLLGEPGTGKSVIKSALKVFDEKRLIIPTVSRTLHTYSGILRILCEAFGIGNKGQDIRCERRLIEEAFRLNRSGKMLAPVIDDAHLIDLTCLRKIRLLFEDFPKNHNLVLIAQPELLRHVSLSINEDIKSRITYSVMMMKLNPDQMQSFLLDQLDKAGLPHNTFSEDALALVVRSAEGVIRRARNLALGCLLQAVRRQSRTIDLTVVNHVLMQPHWRNHCDETPKAPH